MTLFFNSHMPSNSPAPQTTLDASIQNFSEFKTMSWWRERELRAIVEKDALFYEGTKKLQKIVNTA